MFPFCTPWKPQKTFGFLIVLRGYKMGILGKNVLKASQNLQVKKAIY